jgi:hypothetical protein
MSPDEIDQAAGRYVGDLIDLLDEVHRITERWENR